MIDQILVAASIPAKPARFPDPPQTHAVYFDSIEPDGPDTGTPTSLSHDSTIELYAPNISVGAEALQRLQVQLDSRGIRYKTQGWYWLSAIQRYQEVIEFTYTEKFLTGGNSNEN